MSRTRELTLQERSTIICALALTRSEHYRKANSLHAEACEMEDAGMVGYISVENEGEQHEIAADICDLLIYLVSEDRLLIIEREDFR